MSRDGKGNKRGRDDDFVIRVSRRTMRRAFQVVYAAVLTANTLLLNVQAHLQ